MSRIRRVFVNYLYSTAYDVVSGSQAIKRYALLINLWLLLLILSVQKEGGGTNNEAIPVYRQQNVDRPASCRLSFTILF